MNETSPVDLQEIQQLLDQRRYKEAEKRLTRAIDAAPDNGELHAYLALALLYQEGFEPAAEEAKKAVTKAPDNPFCHYVRAQVLMEARQDGAALTCLKTAMELKPGFPPYHLLGATIYYRRQSWEDALREANQALTLGAQSAQAYALRGLALWKLQRKEEARQDFERALALDPTHPLSHAARGWLLLDKGEYRAAQEPFREALRLDPFMEWAKEGLLESIKAQNPLYRPFLIYLLWMARLSPAGQWGALFGIYFVMKIVRLLYKLFPVLKLPLGIVAWIYFILAFLTWVARPLSNLVLRLHPTGRHLLLRSEIAAANWVGVCLLAALGFLIAWLATNTPPLLGAALFSALMMMPVATIFQSSSCAGRGCLTLYALVMLGLAITAVAMGLAGSTDWGLPAGLFGAALLCLSWIANALVTIEP